MTSTGEQIISGNSRVLCFSALNGNVNSSVDSYSEYIGRRIWVRFQVSQIMFSTGSIPDDGKHHQTISGSPRMLMKAYLRLQGHIVSPTWSKCHASCFKSTQQMVHGFSTFLQDMSSSCRAGLAAGGCLSLHGCGSECQWIPRSSCSLGAHGSLKKVVSM